MAKDEKGWRHDNLRELEITTKDGVDVHETEMLKGEAKDSLSGKNVIKQYTVEGPPTEAGGENENK